MGGLVNMKSKINLIGEVPIRYYEDHPHIGRVVLYSSGADVSLVDEIWKALVASGCADVLGALENIEEFGKIPIVADWLVLIDNLDEEHAIQAIQSLKWFNKSLKVVHFQKKGTQDFSRKLRQEVRHLYTYGSAAEHFAFFLSSMNQWGYEAFIRPSQE